MVIDLALPTDAPYYDGLYLWIRIEFDGSEYVAREKCVDGSIMRLGEVRAEEAQRLLSGFADAVADVARRARPGVERVAERAGIIPGDSKYKMRLELLCERARCARDVGNLPGLFIRDAVQAQKLTDGVCHGMRAAVQTLIATLLVGFGAD